MLALAAMTTVAAFFSFCSGLGKAGLLRDYGRNPDGRMLGWGVAFRNCQVMLSRQRLGPKAIL